MARKRVDLVASAGFQNARDRIWAAIRAAKKPFAQADIEFAANRGNPAQSKLRADSIVKYLQGLIAAGFVVPEGGERKRTNVYGRLTRVYYRLARDVGVEAPRITETGAAVRSGLAREAMWQSMKILGEWDLRELAATASTERVAVSLAGAAKYARALKAAGYLAVVARRGNALRYRLLKSKNTGARPPVRQASGAVFDVNLGRVMHAGGE